ncbi:MAG: hypothetical protein HYV17_07965 [Xanthomonadales bacterium]|nr:hypothetical protein [Xanthomonadales bacterium]
MLGLSISLPALASRRAAEAHDYVAALQPWLRSDWTLDEPDGITGDWPSAYDGDIPSSASFQATAGWFVGGSAQAIANGQCAAYQGAWPYAPGAETFGGDDVTVGFVVDATATMPTSTSFGPQTILRYFRDAAAAFPLIEVKVSASRGALPFLQPAEVIWLYVYDAAGAIAATYSLGEQQAQIFITKTASVVQFWVGGTEATAPVDVSASTFAPSVAGSVNHRVEFHGYDSGSGYVVSPIFDEVVVLGRALTSAEAAWFYNAGAFRSLTEFAP